MKTLLVLAAVSACFAFAFFLAALGGAVVGHFTNPKIGFASLFPLALAGMFAARAVLAWPDRWARRSAEGRGNTVSGAEA